MAKKVKMGKSSKGPGIPWTNAKVEPGNCQNPASVGIRQTPGR